MTEHRAIVGPDEPVVRLVVEPTDWINVWLSVGRRGVACKGAIWRINFLFDNFSAQELHGNWWRDLSGRLVKFEPTGACEGEHWTPMFRHTNLVGVRDIVSLHRWKVRDNVSMPVTFEMELEEFRLLT